MSHKSKEVYFLKVYFSGTLANAARVKNPAACCGVFDSSSSAQVIFGQFLSETICMGRRNAENGTSSPRQKFKIGETKNGTIG